MNSFSCTNPFQTFFEKTKDALPHATLLKALELTLAPSSLPFAIDLGCGAGRDTLYLLKKGWKVLAVDREETAFDIIKARVRNDTKERFTPLVAHFSTLELSSYPKADLINASYSLPFCHPDAFTGLWRKIINQLAPGGLFCGQLFGNKHSWSTNPKMTFHTKEQVSELLSLFDVLSLEEEDKPGHDIENNDVHWHVFHVIARLRG